MMVYLRLFSSLLLQKVFFPVKCKKCVTLLISKCLAVFMSQAADEQQQ